MQYPVKPARINWDKNGQPFCDRFNDVYFSTCDGLAESRYVFLQQNRIAERFATLQKNDCFVISETGFGTGLNFLCSWQAFQRQAVSGARLHYIATEKYPLSRQALMRALSLWPELWPLSEQLIAACPTSIAGFHTVSLEQGRIRLTLLIGDSCQSLRQLHGKVDAWFLDGFAPAKNPEMWQPSLYQQMAAHSHAKTTFATFTAARIVRNGLQCAGFSVQKVTGFGRKREMIKGYMATKTPPAETKPVPVWLQPKSTRTENKQVIVIGGGLAGTASARSMAERGWQVTLLEKKSELAAGASGNPQGMLYVRLSMDDTILSRFSLMGYEYSRHKIKQLLKNQPDSHDFCGVIQLAITEKDKLRQQRLLNKDFTKELVQFKTASEINKLAGITQDQTGLWFPGGGWVNPPALCHAMANHSNITVITDCEVTKLSQPENTAWQVTTSQGNMNAPVVIMTCAEQAVTFTQLRHIPLKPIRGQISTLPATRDSAQLQTVLCADSYVAPARQGNHTFGASFNLHSLLPEVSEQDHEDNLLQLKKLSPDLYQALQATPEKINSGRVGFRCTTPDYLPVIGSVVKAEQFDIDFAKLRTNARYPFEQTPTYHEGLYLNSGHGSRGLITCLISGELLAAEINGEPLPIPQDITALLRPTRFQARDMTRNKQ